MEQPSQSGKPVNLNALLIGEKTIPKGCRVMHVSSHGMLLHCEPDGRPRTFNDGDSVDIHLTVQHNGEQKKLTIPSHVRHVSENSLDVEFHHPDPVLLDLIESYRTSDEHTLEASVGDAHTDEADPDIIPMPGTHTHEQLAARLASDRQHSQSDRRTASMRGLIILVCVAGLLTAAYFYIGSLHSRVDALEQIAGNRSSELADMQNKLFSTSLLEGKYASLDARITALGNAMVNLEQRMQAMHAGETSGNIELPSAMTAMATTGGNPPAAETGTVIRSATPAGAAGDTTAQAATPGPALTPSPAAEATPDPAPASSNRSTENRQAASAAAVNSGPWAINLMSSIDRRDPERMARRAEAADIPTTLTSAEIKGRLYWRLQVTGFRSLAEAKARAGTIQQALGIKSVWFHKRKPGTPGDDAGQ